MLDIPVSVTQEEEQQELKDEAVLIDFPAPQADELQEVLRRALALPGAAARIGEDAARQALRG